MHPASCSRGLLVSVEGINAVGKTYLTNLLHADSHLATSRELLVLEGFSQRARPGRDSLGRDLLRALIDAAGGDPFLRGGYPATETLLLLAIKNYDYESCLPALQAGRSVLEGRSVHSVAVYQSLILHDDDESALAEARAILELAAAWRPVPDLTILITDDVDTAVQRGERRDGTRRTPEQWRMHRRAATLFDQLAVDDPHRVLTIDRRSVDTQGALRLMRAWIDKATPVCLAEPWRSMLPAVCGHGCRLDTARPPLGEG